jgi:hypothetical protein
MEPVVGVEREIWAITNTAHVEWPNTPNLPTTYFCKDVNSRIFRGIRYVALKSGWYNNRTGYFDNTCQC